MNLGQDDTYTVHMRVEQENAGLHPTYTCISRTMHADLKG